MVLANPKQQLKVCAEANPHTKLLLQKVLDLRTRFCLFIGSANYRRIGFLRWSYALMSFGEVHTIVLLFVSKSVQKNHRFALLDTWQPPLPHPNYQP